MEVDRPPHPAHPQDERRGCVLNVFVDPSHRRQGVAKLLMQAGEDAFIRRRISYVFLHASKAGRPLYLRTGWTQTNEMAKTLEA
jgi:ribosomal protein S18 acetylase RimI-like enzyme